MSISSLCGNSTKLCNKKIPRLFDQTNIAQNISIWSSTFYAFLDSFIKQGEAFCQKFIKGHISRSHFFWIQTFNLRKDTGSKYLILKQSGRGCNRADSRNLPWYCPTQYDVQEVVQGSVPIYTEIWIYKYLLKASMRWFLLIWIGYAKALEWTVFNYLLRISCAHLTLPSSFSCLGCNQIKRRYSSNPYQPFRWDLWN